MTPLRLTMQAFGPYEAKTELSFEELQGQLFLITGSTGGGKTTILDAMCFALYCRATGGRRAWNQMRNIAAPEDTPTMVEFDFTLGGEQYRFFRSLCWHKLRGSGRMELRDEHRCFHFQKGSWELLVSGTEQRVRDCAQELLGLTCEQFSQVIVLPQGEFRKLLLSNSTEKTKIFQTLFQTEKWELVTRCAQRMAEELRGQCSQSLAKTQAILASEEAENQAALEEKRKTLDAQQEKALQEAQRLEGELIRLAEKLQKAEKLADCEKSLKTAGLQKAEALRAQASAQKQELEAKEAEKQNPGLQEKADKLLTALSHWKDGLQKARQLAELEKEDARLTRLWQEASKDAAQWEQAEKTAAGNLAKGEAYTKELREKLLELPELTVKVQNLTSGAKAQVEANKAAEALRQSFLTEKQSRELLKQRQVTYEALQQKLAAAEEAAGRDMAFQLSMGLKQGAPCPVCGSMEHPAPAARGAVLMTGEELALLKKAAADELERLQKAQASLSGREAERKLREAAFGEARKKFAELAVDAHEIEQTLPKLEAALRGLRKDQELLPQAEKRLELRTNEQKAAKESLEESLNRKRGLEQKQSEIKARVQSAREGLEGLLKALSASKAEQELLLRIKQGEQGLSDLKAQMEENQIKSRRAGEALAAAGAAVKAAETAFEAAQRQFNQAQKEVTAAGATYEKLLEEQAALRDSSRAASQLAGSLTQHRSSVQKAIAELERLEAENTRLQKEYSQMERVSKLLSGKNAMNIPLRIYVLGVMLDDILSRANVYFTDLSNGRYLLARKEEAATRGYGGLDLEIYDAYYGGARGVDTLSGGELFLASLSMAFGLSDVVQSYAGGVRLESIFIDEGFGTLDEETLNTAMNSLRKIQKSGRTVGIISHVGELKSRIPAQIQILSGHRIKVLLP